MEVIWRDILVKSLTGKSIVEIMKDHRGQCLFSNDGLELEYKDLVKNIEEFGKQLSSIDMKNNIVKAEG